MSTLAIVIPCYNEAGRMNASDFALLPNITSEVHFYFVDDGSTDNTLAVLQNIVKASLHKSTIVQLEQNQGKAAAIQAGVAAVLQNNHADYIAYLDADLSTNFTNLFHIYDVMLSKQKDYAFGSRIKMLNNTIIRKTWRHITGRVIASIIDSRYKLRIYDTQCGAKIFSQKLAATIFAAPFHTKWLFDVELFLRIKKYHPQAKGQEVPIDRWEDKAGSKLTLLSVGRVTKDLWNIHTHYK